MSTKIYNGYKVATSAHGFQNLMAWLRPFGNELRTMAGKLEAALLAKYAINLIDAAALGQSPHWRPDNHLQPHNAMVVARDHIDTRRRRIVEKRLRDPEVDFSFEACFLPSSGRQGAVLATIYTEQETMRLLWESQKAVQSYPYWNNTDHPDDMTPQEWDDRGREWQEAIGDGPPSHSGLSFAPCSNDFLEPPLIDLVVMSQPTSEVRRSLWVNAMLLSDYVAAKQPAEQSKEFDWVKWSRTLDEFKAWVMSDAAKEQRTAKESLVRERLKPGITNQDLLEVRVWPSTSNA